MGKKTNRPKEQIAHDMKQAQETKRKRSFVADVLWPLLKEKTKTVNQAKMFCKVIQNDVLATFNGGMNAPLSSLKLEQKFANETDEGAEAYRAFLEAFKDVPINETMELLDGMPNAIDAALQYEDRSRSLDELEFKDGTILAQKRPTFQELLVKTPDCIDFRMLIGNGKWWAYSKALDGGKGNSFRAEGDTIYDALFNLNKLIEEHSK